MPGLISLTAACWQMLVHPWITPSAVIVLAAMALAGTVLAMAVRCARMAGLLSGTPLGLRVISRRTEGLPVTPGRQFRPNAAGRSRPRAPATAAAAA